VVLLCTCGAGRGLLRRGDDGGQTLAGALLRAGATAVGVADTDLELGATQALVRDFLAALAEGLAPDLALRAARRAQVAAGGRLAQVAALRLDGPGFHPLALRVEPAVGASAAARPWWPAALGGALVVVVALVFGLARRRRRAAAG
jgi:hypothetical protein